MKTALITGASSGIGYEMALQLSAKYKQLVLVARSKSKLSELAAKLEQKGCRIFIINTDLSEVDSPANIYSQLKANNIEIDLLINNAGSGKTGLFFSHDASDDQTTINLNILALTQMCKLLGQDMLKRQNGQILNVASTGAFQPGSYISVYYASKAYVYSFSLALADELRNSGVYVGVLCPGATATNFSKNSGKADISNAMSAQTVAKAAIKGIDKRQTIIVPGLGNKLAIIISKLLPDRLMSVIVRKIQKKQYDQFKK